MIECDIIILEYHIVVLTITRLKRALPILAPPAVIYIGFHGTIKNLKTNLKFPKLCIMDLSHNGFSVVDLSNNKFKGKIPKALGSLCGLKVLNVSNKNLIGKPFIIGKSNKVGIIGSSWKLALRRDPSTTVPTHFP
ncbi:hypothetical protein ACSBR2_011843 [Camellia fascicularis]